MQRHALSRVRGVERAKGFLRPDVEDGHCPVHADIRKVHRDVCRATRKHGAHWLVAAATLGRGCLIGRLLPRNRKREALAIGIHAASLEGASAAEVRDGRRREAAPEEVARAASASLDAAATDFVPRGAGGAILSSRNACSKLVVQGHSGVTIPKPPGPHLLRRLRCVRRQADAHLPQWILADRDRSRVEEDGFRARKDLSQVVAHDERGGADGPDRHLSHLLILRDAVRTDQQHVHVVPMPRPRKGCQDRAIVAPMVDDGRQGAPIALNVLPISPFVAAVHNELGERFRAFVVAYVRRPRAQPP
mmetsp:Transcript_22996/g.78288  ORF Transcript_22996/g.78288 Transcript_22996/m.78288 type:complete len:305 (-) Transcript_22996:563-1477(-)